MHLRLEAPMASFGSEAIDARRVTGNFPAQSMVTGMCANALGWPRSLRTAHQRLQDRIVFGAAWDPGLETSQMTDYQTAQLGKSDRAWSTSGAPIDRAGGAKTYLGPHQRWRDYHADLRMSLVVRLEPAEPEPSLEALASALERPSRPLFIGRKACLPTGRIFRGWVSEADVKRALEAVMPEGRMFRAMWPGTDPADADATRMVCDERNWVIGPHGGARPVCVAHAVGRRPTE